MSQIADRSVVVGVIALRLQFISQDDLRAGIKDWRGKKSSTLGEALVARGALTSRQLDVLAPLADVHVSRFGDLPELSLEALQGTSWAHGAADETDDDHNLAETASLAPGHSVMSSNQSEAQTGTDGSTGRYRIVEFYKGGGLGEVYRAQDDQLGRTVALKQIKQKYVHEYSMRRRFVREAEINGRLEHPAIVPVYSLGKHNDGRPFYTMRFVAGDELRGAIKDHHSRQPSHQRQNLLELRQLLRRFVDVCNAIAYAHSRGVVHRDLKPANVLLGSFGETFLIDWGLAKGFADADTDSARSTLPMGCSQIEETELGAQIGTLPYMSPEQARGDVPAVGQAADIYGLGAMLYEILTGQPPAQGNSAQDILRRAKDGHIPHPRSLAPAAPPALSAICLKALAFSPADRYGSAQQLAADVENWLADEPVTAYAEPLHERVGRTIRRNRTAVVGTAVLLVSAIAALGVINVISRKQNVLLAAANTAALNNLAQAQAENRRAEQNLADLRLAAFELQNTAEGMLARAPGAEQERQRMTELLVQTLEKMSAQWPGDDLLNRDLAQAYRIHANLQRLFNRQQVAQEFYVKALKQLDGLSDPGSERAQERLAETLRDQSNSLQATGKVEESIAALTRASAIIKRLHDANPGNSGYARTAATILLDTAEPLLDQERRAEALDCARRAASELRRLADGPARQANDGPLLLLALNREAEVLRELDLRAESVGVLTEGLERARAAVAASDSADTQHSLARLLLNMGQSSADSDRSRAEASLAEAISIWDDLLRKFPQRAFYHRYRAMAFVAQGGLKTKSLQLDEARAFYEQARARLEPIVKGQPMLLAFRETLIEAHVGLAEIEAKAGNRAPSKAQLNQARTHVEQLPANGRQRKAAEAKIAQIESMVTELLDKSPP